MTVGGPFNINLNENVFDGLQMPHSNIMPVANAATYQGVNDSTALAITRAKTAAAALGVPLYIPPGFPGGPALSLLSLNGQFPVAAPTGVPATDRANIQAAITSALTAGGGTVVLQPGTYVMPTAPAGYGVVPAIGTPHNWTNSGGLTVIMQGAGQSATVIQGSAVYGANGVIGYGEAPFPIVATLVLKDLTIDGNYSGVGGGSVGQPGSGAGALVSLPWPDTAAGSTAENGKCHLFERVRFYRPPGFTFQPTEGVKLVECIFDSTGQPDVAAGGLHWDNLGSGQGHAIVLGCSWLNSAGNYADFVDSVGGAGHIIRLIMIGCESFNHLQGGIYAAGIGSVIMGNRFVNVTANAGGIGYDSSTAASMKSSNIVVGNSLTNLSVNNSSLSASHGDLVYGNISSDYPSGTNPMLQGGLLFGQSEQSIAFAATITPDLTQGQYIQVGTLTGNITVANPLTNFPGPANSMVGQVVTFQFTQDGTGSRSVTWGSEWMHAPNHIAPDAGVTTQVTFLSDGTNFWCLTPFVLGVNTVYGADTAFEGGLRFVNGTSNFFSPPRITSDGTHIAIEANSGYIALTPGANSFNNGFSGDNTGLWHTFDGSGASRNVLDDGSGHMQAKFQMYPGAEAGGVQTSGGLLHSTGIPSNANGNNNDWCISDNGHLYFKSAGTWGQKV